MSRIAYLDVLKAFAIIAVVLYHTGLMTYGYLGVDLFLVIAGFLTTKSLCSKMDIQYNLCGGGRFYVMFEISRIIRLLPPLLFAGIFCMLFGYFVMLPDDYDNLSQSVIATNGFGNNILAAITTRNYWDIVNDYKPLMHTWYVGVVMQFYLVYPFLFFFARLNKKNTRSTLLTIISTLAVISLLVYFSTTNTAERFYYLPSRFFEFAVGGIAALIYNPANDKPFWKGYVYLCYVLLLALMLVNVEVMPAIIRLVAVVGLSCVVLCSQDVLENKVTGNAVLAKIGAASYSIFIWHQILLAFYRYTITSKFSIVSYAILFVGTALMSWMSYKFIEQGTTKALKTNSGKTVLYTSTAIAFFALSAFAGFIYMRAGVVRDVPELYISKNDIHRGMHAEYCDRGYQYDKPFDNTKRPHWLVVGNSFGRDFVNVIVESEIADSVDVSYLSDDKIKDNKNRFSGASRVFISTLGLTEDFVTEIENICLENGVPSQNVVIVGEKNFGESNGQIYAKRNRQDYFDQYIEVENRKRYIEKNMYYADLYKERFLDLMSLVSNKDGKVRVFTPDHHFMSADCRHLSLGGAKYFAKQIDWKKFLEESGGQEL